jgi:hypothetical protein
MRFKVIKAELSAKYVIWDTAANTLGSEFFRQEAHADAVCQYIREGVSAASVVKTLGWYWCPVPDGLSPNSIATWIRDEFHPGVENHILLQALRQYKEMSDFDVNKQTIRVLLLRNGVTLPTSEHGGFCGPGAFYG